MITDRRAGEETEPWPLTLKINEYNQLKKQLTLQRDDSFVKQSQTNLVCSPNIIYGKKNQNVFGKKKEPSVYVRLQNAVRISSVLLLRNKFPESWLTALQLFTTSCIWGADRSDTRQISWAKICVYCQSKWPQSEMCPRVTPVHHISQMLNTPLLF